MTSMGWGDKGLAARHGVHGTATLAAPTEAACACVERLNSVNIYMVVIILIRRIVGGTLDPSLVPYQFVWEGAPLPLLRYAAGLPVWSTFAVMMKTGRIESSSEYIVLFTIFTATILWVYALQFTMLWDLRCDWELFSAVAWARELLKSMPCHQARQGALHL